MHKIQLTPFEKIPYFSEKSNHKNRIGFLPRNYFQLLGILNWTPPFSTSYICQSHNQAIFMTIYTYGLAFNLLFDRFICNFVLLLSNFYYFIRRHGIAPTLAATTSTPTSTATSASSNHTSNHTPTLTLCITWLNCHGFLFQL